jgi:hypothetical protein
MENMTWLLYISENGNKIFMTKETQYDKRKLIKIIWQITSWKTYETQIQA